MVDNRTNMLQLWLYTINFILVSVVLTLSTDPVEERTNMEFQIELKKLKGHKGG